MILNWINKTKNLYDEIKSTVDYRPYSNRVNISLSQENLLHLQEILERQNIGNIAAQMERKLEGEE